MAAPSECSLRLRISLAVIGVFVGLSVGIVFGVLYTNWDTSVWGLLSGEPFCGRRTQLPELKCVS